MGGYRRARFLISTVLMRGAWGDEGPATARHIRERRSDYYTFRTMVLFPDRLPRAPARYQRGTQRSSDLLGVTQPGSDRQVSVLVCVTSQGSLHIAKAEMLAPRNCVLLKQRSECGLPQQFLLVAPTNTPEVSG